MGVTTKTAVTGYHYYPLSREASENPCHTRHSCLAYEENISTLKGGYIKNERSQLESENIWQ